MSVLIRGMEMPKDCPFCPKCGRPMTVWEDEIIYDLGEHSRIRREWHCVCGNRGTITEKTNNVEERGCTNHR